MRLIQAANQRAKYKFPIIEIASVSVVFIITIIFACNAQIQDSNDNETTLWKYYFHNKYFIISYLLFYIICVAITVGYNTINEDFEKDFEETMKSIIHKPSDRGTMLKYLQQITIISEQQNKIRIEQEQLWTVKNTEPNHQPDTLKQSIQEDTKNISEKINELSEQIKLQETWLENDIRNINILKTHPFMQDKSTFAKYLNLFQKTDMRLKRYFDLFQEWYMCYQKLGIISTANLILSTNDTEDIYNIYIININDHMRLCLKSIIDVYPFLESVTEEYKNEESKIRKDLLVNYVKPFIQRSLKSLLNKYDKKSIKDILDIFQLINRRKIEYAHDDETMNTIAQYIQNITDECLKDNSITTFNDALTIILKFIEACDASIDNKINKESILNISYEKLLLKIETFKTDKKTMNQVLKLSVQRTSKYTEQIIDILIDNMSSEKLYDIYQIKEIASIIYLHLINNLTIIEKFLKYLQEYSQEENKDININDINSDKRCLLKSFKDAFWYIKCIIRMKKPEQEEILNKLQNKFNNFKDSIIQIAQNNNESEIAIQIYQLINLIDN